MTFSIPIDIKRCILEGVEPPCDIIAVAKGNGEIAISVKRHIDLSRLSAQARVLIAENPKWMIDKAEHYTFHLGALPKFPALMGDDNFVYFINDYAAKWGKE